LESSRLGEAIESEFFRDLGALIEKGIGLGVVLFLAFVTFFALRQSPNFREAWSQHVPSGFVKASCIADRLGIFLFQDLLWWSRAYC